jgi:serine/threonine-protein kinase
MPPPPSVASVPRAMHHPMPPPVPVMPVPSAYPSVPPPGPSAAKTIVTVIAALLVIGLGAALFLLFMPREGTLIVTVAGPGNKPVDAVQVFIDGTKKCDSSPCRAAELGSGTHMVKVSAAGYQQTADQAVKVSGGEEAVLNVTLARASEGTGIKVLAEGSGLKLAVDGKDIGPLPQDLKDMAAGEHTIKIFGSDRYEAYEKKVTVEPEKLLEIDPKLKVIKGLATIKEGKDAEGARVLLVSGSERRPLPRLPIKIDIPTDKPYRIVASKRGFGDFDQELLFEDGHADKVFVIDMTAAPVSAAAAVAPPSVPRAPRAPRAPREPAPPKAPPAALSGAGTLNINSIPVSNVILDGRPLGQTPQVGMSVPAGAHTVVFVHPEHGRKVRSVTVQPGQTATAAVRFP